MNIYTPIDIIPILTSGRNASGADADHPYINLLDNNMDTFWKADTFDSSTFFIDLGANNPSYDTIVLWLHNYNESYRLEKRVGVNTDPDDLSGYSDTIFFEDFRNYMTDYAPLIIIPFPTETDRYIQLGFTNFDTTPISFKIEVSAIWFCNKKVLSHSHQKPESNQIIYHNRKNSTKSGIIQNEPAGFGSSSIITRKFISTNDSAYWNILQDLHSKTRGKQRPFFMIPDVAGIHYHAMNFHKLFSDNMIGYQYHEPTIQFRDIGHEKIPFQERRLYPLAETVGLWRFNDLNGTDESNSGNDLTNNGFDSTDLLIGGITEQGTTVLELNTTDTFEIASGASSSDFEMDTSDFTIESWVLMKSSVAGNERSIFNKITFGPTTGWEMTHTGSFNWGFSIGDGTDGIFVHTGVAHDDDKWHLITSVFDRTAGTLDFYIDGIFQVSRDISVVTGNISKSTVPLILKGKNQNDVIWWDEICITKRKLTSDEIFNRYTGSAKYGEWNK